MEWTDSIQTLVHILVDEEATVLSASGNSSHWHLRILFPNRDALSETYEYCRENDLSLDIRNIYELEQGRKGRLASRTTSRIRSRWRSSVATMTFHARRRPRISPTTSMCHTKPSPSDCAVAIEAS